ncbi:hypothetical protein LOTGIDRAFT_155009 [Lottia gigantea]|uniref:Uncharacterized protein n=1 Tax=Lottia gigantea TaxID=225164 RepID=V3ZMI8_LOTGI|nr:hypothetical protein LOTGIDRAFT_155009 [Lottia gigantea]ESO85522.1 hypothetical protein LOTGIDRAFT_155009 [Lottia gigantea]
MNEFLDKYGTDTTTNFQLMRWANELNISPFYYCMRDEINDLKYKKGIKYSETKLNSELQKELRNIKQQIQNIDDSEIKTYIQQQIQNIDDSEIKTYIQQQIQNIDDSVIQQQITTINNLVLKHDKNIVALEKKYLKKESYYFKLTFGVMGIHDDPSITDNTDESKDYEYKKYGFTANIRVYSFPNYTIYPNNIFDSDDENDYHPIFFIFRGKLIIEINFPFQVKVDSIFFRQNSRFSNKFNARKVLQFINGTKNVETKEFEINDENSKPRHLYEIKTSGKYIDRFRMLIIPDNEEVKLSLSDFDMLLETESPPASIIRNPKPQKEIINYQFLRATDFEYVKLYFVDNDIFTSIDIHKSQQQQNFLIPTKRDDVSVTMFLTISKPKFSVHLNKINDLKEQIFLVSMQFFSKVALSEII